MAITTIGGTINSTAVTSNLDYKYGPYTSLQEAYNALGPSGLDKLAIGLTVGILEDGVITEYWFKEGITLSNLVKKQVSDLSDLSEAVITTSEQSLTDAQKLQAQANLNDTDADDQTGKMGYKVLQPQDDTDLERTSFDNQIKGHTDTIFEIRDVYNLYDSSVTIPNNCTLKFNGGMIVGGTVDLNGCNVVSTDSKAPYQLIEDMLGVCNLSADKVVDLTSNGLVPDDDTTSVMEANGLKLKYLVEAGCKFEIKDTFYITMPATGIFTTNLYITGGTLYFKGNTTGGYNKTSYPDQTGTWLGTAEGDHAAAKNNFVLGRGGSVNLKGTKIAGYDSTPFLIFYNSNREGFYFDKIHIESCSFEYAQFRWVNPLLVSVDNPATDTFGLNSFILKDSIINNCSTVEDGNPFAFAHYSTVWVKDEFLVEGNVFNNMIICVNNGITNKPSDETTYYPEIWALNLPTFVVRDNVFNMQPHNVADGKYFCGVLMEGLAAEVTGNVFKNIINTNTEGGGCYEIYGGVQRLLFENNTTINLLSVADTASSTAGRCEMVKSKGCPAIQGQKLVRIIRNNKWTWDENMIEEEYEITTHRLGAFELDFGGMIEFTNNSVIGENVIFEGYNANMCNSFFFKNNYMSVKQFNPLFKINAKIGTGTYVGSYDSTDNLPTPDANSWALVANGDGWNIYNFSATIGNWVYNSKGISLDKTIIITDNSLYAFDLTLVQAVVTNARTLNDERFKRIFEFKDNRLNFIPIYSFTGEIWDRITVSNEYDGNMKPDSVLPFSNMIIGAELDIFEILQGINTNFLKLFYKSKGKYEAMLLPNKSYVVGTAYFVSNYYINSDIKNIRFKLSCGNQTEEGYIFDDNGTKKIFSISRNSTISTTYETAGGNQNNFTIRFALGTNFTVYIYQNTIPVHIELYFGEVVSELRFPKSGATADLPKYLQADNAGFVYYDTDEEIEKIWNGTEWISNGLFSINTNGLEANITIDNDTTEIEGNKPFIAKLTADAGTTVGLIKIIMGDYDITSFAYNADTNVIYIASVTDDVEIESVPSYPIDANGLNDNVTFVNPQRVEENKPFTATLTPSSGTTIGTVTIFMGSVDITSEVYDGLTGEINIPAVTGKVEICSPLTLTAKDAGATVKLQNVNNSTSCTVQYSTDRGANWSDLLIDDGVEANPTTVTLTNVGDTVMFKAKTTNSKFATSGNSYHRFVIGNGSVDASGCVTSLLNGKGGDMTLTNTNQRVFQGLFYQCTGLASTPYFPSTTLSPTCYYTTFYGCTGLTKAKVLPATSLNNSSYGFMFNSCSNLNEVRILATDISATDCIKNWLNSVAATGSLYCDSSLTLVAGTDYPSGWTRYNLDGTRWG